LIPLILNHFLVPTTSRIEAIRCFTEIASLQLEDSDELEKRAIKEKICMYFCLFIQKVMEIIKNRSLIDEFKQVQGSKAQTGFENFAKQLALSVTAVMKGNIDLIEETTNTMEPNQNILFLQQCIQKCLEIMIQLSSISEDELFKICLDFWHFFCLNVMMKTKGN
jgi:exportin-1